MVSGVNQPLARWAVNYRGLFPKRSGTRIFLPTRPLTRIVIIVI